MSDKDKHSSVLAVSTGREAEIEKYKNNQDWRNIKNGYEIPTEYYSDQPFLVKADDGAWVCTLTTGSSEEGNKGQHVIAVRSNDKGENWTKPIDVEPGDGPEASYAVLLKTPYGRIYTFYNHNTDNIREIPCEKGEWFPDEICTRVDSIGYFVFKYSDDNGETWSDKRYNIPSREFLFDRNNAHNGKVRYFWNVGKPFILNGACYLSLHKVGGFGEGFFTKSEGVLLRSENILTEKDPGKIKWETLPDGEVGLRAPKGGGPIAEEQSYITLSDGSIYVVYRTIDGHPAFSYSRDGGHTWDKPKYKRYASGKLIKHPRAANFVWKCENGKYLYWFHNNGGTWYEDRNPVWLCGGIEVDSPHGKIIKWTEPEIVLYEDDPYVRISYPDMIEEDGELYLTETQKDKARVHKINREFLEKLWNQFDICEISKKGLLAEYKNFSKKDVIMPVLNEFLTRDLEKVDYGTKDLRKGFTIDMELFVSEKSRRNVIMSNKRADDSGISVSLDNDYRMEISISDGRTVSSWKSDENAIRVDELNNITIIVDGGPKIISFVINGILNDGGEERQFGWGRLSPNLMNANGGEKLKIPEAIANDFKVLRIYNVPLMTTEAIGNYRCK